MRPCLNGRLPDLRWFKNRRHRHSLNTCTFQLSAVLRLRSRPLLATPHYWSSCCIDLIAARGGGSCELS